MYEATRHAPKNNQTKREKLEKYEKPKKKTHDGTGHGEREYSPVNVKFCFVGYTYALQIEVEYHRLLVDATNLLFQHKSIHTLTKTNKIVYKIYTYLYIL